ncbi:MAG: hypothetical protein M5R38_05950 [Candidatus Methylomirabilis sp.]|nr:hypothetical protein [Candidatus Methylomirabilis sp.]
MRIARLLAVSRKEVIQIRRDPRSLGMAFVIPMILLFLFGYALTLDVDNLQTIVYDQDRTAASRGFLAQFEASGYFRVAAIARNYSDVEWALDSGKAQVGLVIPGTSRVTWISVVRCPFRRCSTGATPTPRP